MDEQVMNVMQCTFGFTEFKSQNQRDGVFAVLKGDRDVFINLPPASGKTLCYQLPAIISQEKSTIVFVRNNNTAQEHINFFIGKSINVCHIDSSIRPEKRQERVEQLKLGTHRASLIYIPVSLCNKSWIRDLITTLGSCNLIFTFVVDEALYLSRSSVNFNKLFLNLVPLRNIFPNIPWIILTASSSLQIKYDIFDALSIKNPYEIKHDNWILPNIYLQVKFKDIIPNPYLDLIELINNFKEKIQGKFCGIIFCQTKEETIIVAREISRHNIRTVPYNSSMKILERKKNKSMWKVGRAAMIAVTHGSAIGLDKPNVTCIIHWSVPPSILEYYQEIGKAGRNGIKSLGCLYFSLKDWMYIKKLTAGMSPHVYDNSEKMIQFCLSEGCRHAMYSKYFKSTSDHCQDSCDWCVEKDKLQMLLEEFNNFQRQNRMLPLSPEENRADYLNMGVYNVKATKNIIKNMKPHLRFHWYDKLAYALINNYKVAQYQIRMNMSMRNLCRLARNLEYSQLLASRRRTAYTFAMSKMVNVINKQTINVVPSYYISNYDCLTDNSPEHDINSDMENLLCKLIRKSKDEA